jgi:hypothetical protein
VTTTDPTSYVDADPNWVNATQIPQSVIDASTYLSALQDAYGGAVIVYADGAAIVDPQPVADWSNPSPITQGTVANGKSTQELWAELHEYPATHAASWNAATAESWYVSTWLPQIESSVVLTSGSCGCSAKWTKLTALSPPDYSSARNFAYWAFSQHLKVSKTILHHHFAKFTWEQTKTRWGYPGGW